MNGFSLKKGDSRFFFVLTIINAAVFTVWNAAYFINAFLREAAFATAQANMALTGQSEYTLMVSSPAYGFLKAVVYILPVILILWTAFFVVTERKGKELCSGLLILWAFASDALAAILCAVDIASLKMIF